MRDAARRNAKNPALPFEADSESKQREVPAALREAAESLLVPLYCRLTGGTA